jgi:Sigma-70, region 4
VLLVYAEEQSHAEAAVIMGCSEKTVSWHLHEARKRLKIKLEAPPPEAVTCRLGQAPLRDSTAASPVEVVGSRKSLTQPTGPDATATNQLPTLKGRATT